LSGFSAKINPAGPILGETKFGVTGLYSALLQPSLLGTRTSKTAPVVHCKKRKHWITVSTKWCIGDQVAVYDSMFTKLDADTRTMIMTMLYLKKTEDIIVMPMLKQHECTDCVVFAVAIMTLAHEEDPTRLKFKQMELTQHLVNCITKGKLVCFPKQ